ncbi:MAG: lipid II flippase MurJ [Planctomycetota bacterium]
MTSLPDVTRRIWFAAVVVGGFALAARGGGVLRELAVADRFGTAGALDAFLAAYLLPSLAVGIIAGAAGAAVIPEYLGVRAAAGPGGARRFLARLMSRWLLALLVATAVLGVAAPVLLEWAGSGPRSLLARRWFFWLLPTLAAGGLASLWTAILNAEERYAGAALATAVTPLLAAGAVIGWGKTHGIDALAAGTLVGVFLEAGVLGTLAARRGLLAMPRWEGSSAEVRRVVAQFLPAAGGSVLMAGTAAVDLAMAGFLGPGSVATLNYGGRAAALVTGVGALALGTAVFPHFARQAATRDWGGLRRTRRECLRGVLAVSVPATAMLVALSEPMARILFERGAFTPEDTRRVAAVQTLYFLQVPFFLAGIVQVRVVAVLKMNRILFYTAAGGFLLKIALNLLFMRGMGLRGIALATAVVFLGSAVFLSWITERRIPGE